MPKPLTRTRNYFEHDLVIKTSKIPGAGKGVFTKVDIEKEHIITEFSGEKISHTIAAARFIMKQSHSLLYLNKKYSIDSITDPECVATYINDATGINKIPHVKNNAMIVSSKGRLFVIAKRKINKNEELYMSYGKNYWSAVKKYKLYDVM